MCACECGRRVYLPTWQRCVPGRVKAPTVRYCAGSTPCCPHRSISTPARLEHLHFPRATRAHKGRESMEHLKRTFAPPARRLAFRIASRRTSRSQPCRCACRPRALPLCPRPKTRACADGCVCDARYSSGQAELRKGDENVPCSAARAPRIPGGGLGDFCRQTNNRADAQSTRSTRALALPQRRWAAVEQQRRNTAGVRGRFWAGGAIDSLLLLCCGCLECSRSRLAERGSELSAWCLIVNSLMLLSLIDTILC
jgi:hypothetical protein